MEFIEVDRPFNKIGMDLLGPIPSTPMGNRYIIVAVDYMTKWTETRALQNRTAEEAAQYAVDDLNLNLKTRCKRFPTFRDPFSPLTQSKSTLLATLGLPCGNQRTKRVLCIPTSVCQGQ